MHQMNSLDLLFNARKRGNVSVEDEILGIFQKCCRFFGPPCITLARDHWTSW